MQRTLLLGALLCAAPLAIPAMLMTSAAQAQSAFEAAQGRGREAALDAAQPSSEPSTLEAIATQALDSDTIAYDFVEGVTTEVGPRQAGTEAEARARRAGRNVPRHHRRLDEERPRPAEGIDDGRTAVPAAGLHDRSGEGLCERCAALGAPPAAQVQRRAGRVHGEGGPVPEEVQVPADV
ncbi:MAG: hypothetical protein AAFZ11_08750, partial [Pseudomonadota bacterium]